MLPDGSRLSRRAALLAFFGAQPRRPVASRMTITEGWDWLFRWCGLTPTLGLPTAA